MKVELSKSQCKDLAEWIEMGLLDEIRRDETIDSLEWVRNMLDAADTLKNAAAKGYNDATD